MPIDKITVNNFHTRFLFNSLSDEHEEPEPHRVAANAPAQPK
jgi:hypothetical protein